MRILLFAQLCKLYTFYLVAIATVALGAPLKNATILRRDTNPGCPRNFPLYVSSRCLTATLISATCKTRSDPPVYLFGTPTPCNANEHCIEHYSPIDFNPKNPSNPHATCVNDRNSDIWDNFSSPRQDACSAPTPFNNRGQPGIMVAMSLYDEDSRPIQVLWLGGYDNNNLLPVVYNQHSYIQYIANYHNEDDIKLCFNAATNTRVRAYAAAWPVYNSRSMSVDASTFDNSSDTINTLEKLKAT